MFISRRIVTPYVGKTQLVIERAKKMSAIMETHGAKTRVAQVYAGEGAGDIHLYGFFDTMAAGTKAANGMLEDNALATLFDERAKAKYMSDKFKTKHHEMTLKSGDMERWG